MKKITRYFLRFGLRWAIWGVRFAIICAGVLACDLLLRIQPSGWAIVAFVALYAIWRAESIIKGRPPSMNITVLKAEHAEISDSKFTLHKDHLEDAVTTLIRERAA